MDDGKVPLRLHRSFFFFRASIRTSVAAPMAAVADDLDTILKHTGCHNWCVFVATLLVVGCSSVAVVCLSSFVLWCG